MDFGYSVFSIDGLAVGMAIWTVLTWVKIAQGEGGERSRDLVLSAG